MTELLIIDDGANRDGDQAVVGDVGRTAFEPAIRDGIPH
jgi:hypothetical protein